MAREITLTTAQIEALQTLNFAAQHAVAAFDDEGRVGRRVELIAEDAREALLIGTGYPPKWLEGMDRESAGTSIQDLWRAGTFPAGCEGPLRKADILTLEELAGHMPGEIEALDGIGPVRIAALAEVLEDFGLSFSSWAVTA